MNKYIYLAGVLDMQGQFLLRPIDKVTIAVSTIDLDYVGFLHREYGGDLMLQKPATQITRKIYRWSISERQQVLEMLEGVLPFLHTSMQHQAEILAYYLARQPVHAPYHRPTFYEYREYQQVELALRSLRNLGRPGWEVPTEE